MEVRASTKRYNRIMHRKAGGARNPTQRQIQKLRAQRRRSEARLRHIELRLDALGAKVAAAKASNGAFDRWLDELSEGVEPLPQLPDDFSRADLYDDHD